MRGVVRLAPPPSRPPSMSRIVFLATEIAHSSLFCGVWASSIFTSLQRVPWGWRRRIGPNSQLTLTGGANASIDANPARARAASTAVLENMIVLI